MKKFLLLMFLLTSCGKSLNTETHTFNVVKGDSLSRVASRLEQQNIINSTFQLRLLAKLTDQENIKIGSYKIPPQTSTRDLLKILNSGIGIQIPITIPEGQNIFEIAAKLEDNGITSAKDFFKALTDPRFFRKFNLDYKSSPEIQTIRRFKDKNNNQFATPESKAYTIEGYLFPETYYLQSNMQATDVVEIMTDTMLQVIEEENVITRAKEKGMTLNDLLTFASIIQKEATGIAEMPKVAGVYQNRIDIDMPLQADPTIIYALLLDNEYDGNIRTKHVRPPWPSTYNTYYTNGLPPGPIASPGREAIRAALNPEKHPYFYFVRAPDGSHTYSKTLQEHNEAVEKWVNYVRGR